MPDRTSLPARRSPAPFLRALGGVSLLVLVLILPMLWNGGPFIFHDTASYLVQSFNFRAIAYSFYLSAILALTGTPAGIVVGQALMLAVTLIFTAWVFEWPLEGFLCTAAFLLFFSMAPVTVSYAMPDIFTALGFLLLYAGLEGTEKLRKYPRLESAWILCVVSCIAFHNANVGILLVVLAGWGVFEWSQGRLARLPWRSIAAIVALSLLLFRLEPGLRWQSQREGSYCAPFLVSRLAEENLVQKYGSTICHEHPENKLACADAGKWLTTPDFFLWDPASPLQKLTQESHKMLVDVFAEVTPDCIVIIKYILAKERFKLIPLVANRIWIIFHLEFGEELRLDMPFQNAAETFAMHIPGIEPVILGEKQNRPEYMGAIVRYTGLLNSAGSIMGWTHVFLLLTAWLWSRKLHRFAAYTALVIFSNNAVCAVFSNMNAPRYPARVAFLSALVLAVFLMEIRALIKWGTRLIRRREPLGNFVT